MTISIKEIKEKFEAYFIAEAETETKRMVADLDTLNDSILHLRTFVSDMFSASLTTVTSLSSDAFYEKSKGMPPCHPRTIFKISQYKHREYGDVWLAYTSNTDPLEAMDETELSYIFILAQIGNKHLIIRSFLYSDFESDGEYYQWEGVDGDPSLTLDSLEGPLQIERYGEPWNYKDGLENYHKDI